MTVIGNAKGNSQLVWENIKKLSGKIRENSVKDLELKFDGELVSEPTTFATKLKEYFQNSVNEISEQFIISAPPQISCNKTGSALPQSIGSELNFKSVTETDVSNIIYKLKNSKTRDDFGIDTNFLKCCKTGLLKSVTHLINSSITQAAVPLKWKVAKVTPIHKSGEKTDPANQGPRWRFFFYFC